MPNPDGPVAADLGLPALDIAVLGVRGQSRPTGYTPLNICGSFGGTAWNVVPTSSDELMLQSSFTSDSEAMDAWRDNPRCVMAPVYDPALDGRPRVVWDSFVGKRDDRNSKINAIGWRGKYVYKPEGAPNTQCSLYRMSTIPPPMSLLISEHEYGRAGFTPENKK